MHNPGSTIETQVLIPLVRSKITSTEELKELFNCGFLLDHHKKTFNSPAQEEGTK